MNYMKAIMDAEEISFDEMSKRTGIGVGHVRRLCKDENINTATKATQAKVAKALGITVNALVNGSQSVKKRILSETITRHLVAITEAMRGYTDIPLDSTMFVQVREPNRYDRKSEMDYITFTVFNGLTEDPMVSHRNEIVREVMNDPQSNS